MSMLRDVVASPEAEEILMSLLRAQDAILGGPLIMNNLMKVLGYTSKTESKSKSRSTDPQILEVFLPKSSVLSTYDERSLKEEVLPDYFKPFLDLSSVSAETIKSTDQPALYLDAGSFRMQIIFIPNENASVRFQLRKQYPFTCQLNYYDSTIRTLGGFLPRLFHSGAFAINPWLLMPIVNRFFDFNCVTDVDITMSHLDVYETEGWKMAIYEWLTAGHGSTFEKLTEECGLEYVTPETFSFTFDRFLLTELIMTSDRDREKIIEFYYGGVDLSEMWANGF